MARTSKKASQRLFGKHAAAHNLAALCRRDFDKVLDKSNRTSWTRRPLSDDQIAYAARDVEVLVELHALFSKLQSELPLEPGVLPT